MKFKIDMALKDWKKNVDIEQKISYENVNGVDEVFIVPRDFNKLNGSWELHRPIKMGIYDTMYKTDYRGKREATKALNAFMRSH